MAQTKKPTQASRVASSKKNSVTGKSTASQKKESKQPEQKPGVEIPVRLISSLTALAFFVVFLVTMFNSDGAIVHLFYSLVLGLFGNVAFYVAIPGLLYLFYIHAFSGKRPIVMRSICLGAFILICGIFHEVVLIHSTSTKEFASFAQLYSGGIAGSHAGVVCGGLAALLRFLCGNAISYILLVIGGVLTLLASMQITIPSVIRAVRNRPKADWEQEELEEERVEPAAVVVNHIANKRIERIERMEEKRREQVKQEQEPKSKKKTKAEDLIAQIDQDVDTPVAAAETRVTEPNDDSIFSPVGSKPKKQLTEDIPRDMPVLDMDDVVEDIPPVVADPIAQEQPPKVTAKETAESAAQVAAEIAFLQKDYESAINYWDATFAKGKKVYTAPLALYNKAVCLEQLGKTEEAAKLYKDAADYEGFVLASHALFNYARVLETLGNYTEAVAAYKEVSDKYPSDKWANLAKTRVIALQVENKAE